MGRRRVRRRLGRTEGPSAENRGKREISRPDKQGSALGASCELLDGQRGGCGLTWYEDTLDWRESLVAWSESSGTPNWAVEERVDNDGVMGELEPYGLRESGEGGWGRMLDEGALGK